MRDALIVTFYTADNYGAFWQAYSVGQYIKKCGYEVSYLRDAEMEKSLLIADSDFNAEKNRKIETAIKEEFKVVEKSEHIYDLAVFGSDEIWNRQSLFDKKRQQYWGSGVFAKKKISYAPCAVGAGLKRLIFKYPQLKKFDGVSVRDPYTHRVISTILRRDIPIVLDPTFLISYEMTSERIIPEDYLFVYSYGLSEEIIQKIKAIAKEKNLKVVVSGCKVDWADYNPACTPFEWLSLFKYAEFVVSTTFHGTVFSIIFEKQFILWGNSDKAKYLLNMFDLSNRACESIDEVEGALFNAIDCSNVRKKKNEYLGISVQYLNRYALEQVDNDCVDLCSNKENCCGCTACYSACPTNAIYMIDDEEGFKYPVINAYKCIRCKKCIQVCSFKKEQKEKGYLD